jgi:glutathione S-transferase
VANIDGDIVPDSTAIIAALEERFPDPPLYPDDPAERARALELEDYFDERLAPAIRVFGWQHILAQPGGFANALVPDAPERVKRRLNTMMKPAAGVILRKDYGIDAERAEDARRDILAAMDRVEAELGGREYLVGERFSVADLTAASLFTPIMRPAGRPHLPADPAPAVAAFAAELDARPGGRWVHEMYARHRGTSAEVAAA